MNKVICIKVVTLVDDPGLYEHTFFVGGKSTLDFKKGQTYLSKVDDDSGMCLYETNGSFMGYMDYYIYNDMFMNIDYWREQQLNTILDENKN